VPYRPGRQICLRLDAVRRERAAIGRGEGDRPQSGRVPDELETRLAVVPCLLLGDADERQRVGNCAQGGIERARPFKAVADRPRDEPVHDDRVAALCPHEQ